MDELVSAEAPGFPSDPGAPPAQGTPEPVPSLAAAARVLRRAAGVVPFGVYMALGLGAPLVAVAIGAFQNPNGGFTLSNVKTATHGIYLHGFAQSIELSVIAAVLPGIFGLLIAYSIWTAKRGSVLRQVAITASGVFANFGGVPLACGIVTIATFLGSLTRVSVLLSEDVTVQVDVPSTEAPAPGAPVEVKMTDAPVLVTERR